MAARSWLVVGVAGMALALGGAAGGVAAAGDLGPDNTQAKHLAAGRVLLLDDPDSGGQVNARTASPDQAAPPTVRD